HRPPFPTRRSSDLCACRLPRAPLATLRARASLSRLRRERLPQNLSQVAHAYGLSAGIEPSAQMRQAARVVSDDAIDPRRFDVGELALEHPVRDLGVLEAEASAEPAADRRLRHLHDLDTGDVAEQPPRLVMHTEHVRRLTCVVVGRAKTERTSLEATAARAFGGESRERSDPLGEAPGAHRPGSR